MWPCISLPGYAIRPPRGRHAGILDRDGNYKAQASHRQAEAVIEKIVNGKMEKLYEENCLYEKLSSKMNR